MSDARAPERAIDFPREKREFDEFELHRTLGLTLEDMRPGFARVCMKTSSLTKGGVGGSVHGGLLAALVDVAMLRALSPLFRLDEQPGGTADLNITYLRPALGARIYAEAEVLRKGRSLAVTEVSILDELGTLLAKGRTIYSLRPRPAANALDTGA